MTWCVKTITIQIGNSDDRLSQERWCFFVSDVEMAVLDVNCQVHFAGSPSASARFQNAAWVITLPDSKIPILKEKIAVIRAKYLQDSAAWTEGETQFI